MWRERKEIEVGSVYVRPSRHRFYLPPGYLSLPITTPTRIHFSPARPSILHSEEDRETITCIRVHTFLCLFVAPPKTKHASLPFSRVLPHSAIIAFRTRAVAARHKEQNHRTEPYYHPPKLGGIIQSYAILPVWQSPVPCIPPGMQRVILSFLAPSYVDDGKSWNESPKIGAMNQNYSWPC